MRRFFRVIYGLMGSWLFGAMAIAPASTHAITIDNFNDASAYSALPGQIINELVDTPNALGGRRTYRIQNSSSSEGNLNLRTDAGRLKNTHEESVGRSMLSWDGGGIDLEEDGGTAFVLSLVGYDLPGGQPTDLTITIHDPSNTDKFSRGTITLTEFTTLNRKDFSILFADLADQGPAGPADVGNVGLITLEIFGNVPIDLSFDALKTNGTCDAIPPVGGKAFDECNICGGPNRNGVYPDKDDCSVCFGDNSTCADCAGVPNGSAVIDDCGVCGGNNKDVDDCGVCGGKNSSKDACGVCGGDGSSCTDCFGIPNGPAVVDVCGVCGGDGKKCLDCEGIPFGPAAPDRCGVCGGDGSTCLECTATNLEGLAEKLKQKSFEQQLHNLTFLDKVASTKPRLVRGIRKKVERAYKNLLVRIGELPVEVKSCASALCIDSEINIQTVESYQGDAQDLYRLSLRIFDSISKLKSNGVCEGSLKQCLRRAKARKRELRYLKSFARRLLKENIELSKSIPLKTSICQ